MFLGVFAWGAALAGPVQPPGPPWTTDFPRARREALRDGRPLFLYFTKTH